MLYFSISALNIPNCPFLQITQIILVSQNSHIELQGIYRNKGKEKGIYAFSKCNGNLGSKKRKRGEGEGKERGREKGEGEKEAGKREREGKGK